MSELQRSVSDPSICISVDNDIVKYPENHLLALFETGGQVIAATQALTANGFLTSEVSVACGKEAADALASTTGRSGVTNLIIRIANGLGLTNEEAEIKNHFTEALHAGKLVLSVQIQGDERKGIARQIVVEQGASTVIYLGRFTIEMLQR